MREYIKKQKPPLNSERLERLALHYAGRYATTQAKLRAYLERKIRESGWDEEKAADVEALVARFADLRYVDDAAFAVMRTASLGRRGYGLRRVEEDLREAGLAEHDRQAARQQAAQQRWRAAETFARKRKIGPFSTQAANREMQQKQIGAFLRAGHDLELARRFVQARPGEIPVEE